MNVTSILVTASGQRGQVRSCKTDHTCTLGQRSADIRLQSKEIIRSVHDCWTCSVAESQHKDFSGVSDPESI
jgi:hypothetical protein